MAYIITNITPGNRGLGLSDGTTLALAPGATSAPLELTAAEVAEAEATEWFKVEAVEEAKPAKAAKPTA